VRADLGFPPLVTPTSQIVGTQAVINVLSGERYRTTTNEVKAYLEGRYGRAPGQVNEVVRRMAIGDRPVIDCRPADLLKDELMAITDSVRDLVRSPEDVLTYAMFPEVAREFLEGRDAGTLVPEPLEPIGAGHSAQGPVLTEFNITVHGETYHVHLRGTGHKTQEKRPFYLTLDGMPEEVLVEAIHEVPEGQAQQARTGVRGSKRPRASREGHVTTSMPGNIVDVLVKVGDRVAAGDPVIVTEAMKMETEIQAPIAGKVSAIHVAKGESVNPDEALIEIEAG
jgi:pyruvate carboxylase subunit B